MRTLLFLTILIGSVGSATAVVASSTTPDEFTAYLRHDYEKWRSVVKDTGIKLSD